MSSSLWMQISKVPQSPRLTSDKTADVCIIGAGIAGLTSAYFLAKQGKSVLIVDQGEIGQGQTAFTTAHLANAVDDRYFELERIHGHDLSRLAAESHTFAIDRI